MDIAHEWQEQQIIDREELAAENALRERAIAAGFTDLHGGIEDHGAGLRGRLPGHQNAIFVKEYFRENRDSAINRAMAEVVGWKRRPEVQDSKSLWDDVALIKACNDAEESSLPNFLLDLNAVAQVVGTMLFSQRLAYRNELKSIMLPGHTVATEECIDATARQRCTAILKTLNRWNPEWDYPI